MIKEALHTQEKKSVIINISNKNFTNVLKLFAINNTTEKNKNQAKNKSIIIFNKDQIEFCSMPKPDSTLDLEIKYKKLLNKSSRNNSPIAHRLRSSTSSKN